MRDRKIPTNKAIYAYEMSLWDRFYCGFPGLWQCCGWISAVYHIAAINLATNEKRIISCHCEVRLFDENFGGGLGI